MKLRKIYSNLNGQFHNIRFKDGLNVVLAQITDMSKTDKDTHNLGKTLLISVIDFLLLKGINTKRKFFLTKGGFEGQFFMATLSAGLGTVDQLLGALRDHNDVAEYGVELFRQLNHVEISFSSELWKACRMASSLGFIRVDF